MTQWGHGGQPGPDPFGGPPQFSGPPQFGGPDQPVLPPQPERYNTFSTLSMIFAFVFAPAGAIFGHIGLHQTTRTHQLGRNRAIVGLILSYTMVFILVAGLVAWFVWPDSAQSPPTTIASAAPPSPGETPTKRKPPGEPCGTHTGDAPTFTAGKNYPPAELAGLLIDADGVKAAMEEYYTSKNFGQLTVEPTATEPLSDAIGRVTPEQCTVEMLAGTADAFSDTGYTGMAVVVMTEPTTGALMIQAAVSYPDQTTAHQVMVDYASRFGTDKNLTMTFTPADGGEPVSGTPEARSNRSVIQAKTHPDLAHTNSDRSVFQGGNVIIDLAFVGTLSTYPLELKIRRRMNL